MSTDTTAVAEMLREPPLMGGGLPILGHAVKLLRDPLGFLETLRDHGELVRIKLGPKSVYVVCSPELANSMLVTHGRAFKVEGPFWEAFEPLLGNGLASSNGDQHKRQRRLIQPAFRPDRVTAYTAAMTEEARAAADRWHPGDIIDTRTEFADLAIRILARTVLAIESIDNESKAIGSALDTLLDGMYQRMIIPFGPLYRIPTPANRRFDTALATAHRVIDEVITQRRASKADYGDVLADLLAATDEKTGKPWPSHQIHDNLLTLVIGGTETVTATLGWVFHFLSQRPADERRIRNELDAVAPDRSPIGFAGLPRLPHTRNFITESMRLRPAAWIITRRASTEVNLGGYRIPAGADLVYSAHALHRDPRSFARPHEFDPERWRPGRAESVPRHAMLPFSAGNRKCPGDNFAMAELTLTLAAILQRWHLAPVPQADTSPSIGLSLRPKRLLMRVEHADLPGPR